MVTCFNLIESENRTIFARQSVNGRATVADKVLISLKEAIALPWDRQVLREWNHLFFFTLYFKEACFSFFFFFNFYYLIF
jgi:hypothetical protein